MDGLMIIITGASATGKTVLSKKLGSKLKLSVINKDEIKELLFDNLGVKDESWAGKLGVTSFELCYMFAEKLCNTGKSFILEGNFENRYASKIFSRLKENYKYRILQIYCYGQVEVLYDRYISRDNSGERHPGHIISIQNLEQYKERVNNKDFKLDIDDGKRIDLDTTNFELIDIEAIYEMINLNYR
ncbi:AAA family ATPase [Clostridium manihotivorum]|nr:AAA family ATPase [Clostridium manihotivorum]